MKKKNLKVVSIFVIALLFFQSSIQLVAVTVPVGTMIQLEVTNTISTLNAHIGQKVNFRVLNDVSINGELAVKGGSRAVGKVVSVDKNGALGKPGSMSIQLSRVTAVDGNIIPISANSVLKGQDKSTTAIVVTLLLCVFGLFIEGGDAVLQAGSIIEAEVISAVEINTSEIVEVVEPEPVPVAKIEQGVYLEITTGDGDVILGNLDSKSEKVISVINLKTLYKIQINRINSILDENGNDITNELFALEDFETTTKHKWNSIIIKEIK